MNNTSFNTNRVFLLATFFLLLGTATRFCKAEGFVEPGDGENGVNRRVITPADGYTAVSGTFSEPDFSVPAVNTYRDKPSFYLGGKDNRLEADAGFQWDPSIAMGRLTVGGWTVFVRAGNAWTNYSLDGRTPWHAPKGSLGSNIGMTYQVNPADGSIRLSISGLTPAAGAASFGFGLGADPLGPKVYVFDTGSSFPVYPKGLTSTMAIKRVVAMTQNMGAHADGSYVTGVGFSGGRLSKTQANPAPAGGYSFAPVAGGWPVESVDQANTGYDTAESAYPHDRTYQDTPDDPRCWIVDFDFAGMPQANPRGPGNTTYPHGEYRDIQAPARYPAEVVHIELGLGPARVGGLPVR